MIALRSWRRACQQVLVSPPECAFVTDVFGYVRCGASQQPRQCHIHLFRIPESLPGIRNGLHKCLHHGLPPAPQMSMQGTTEEERLAIALVMKRLGQTMDQIGWDKRLRDLTATDVTALIEEVLEGYGVEMSRLAAKAEVQF